MLIAEDSEDDKDLMRLGFSKVSCPFRIQFVKDGIQAVQYLCGEDNFSQRDQYPLPSVVLTDLKMPRMDGFELIKWIRTQPDFEKLPVIVLSSSNQIDDRIRAMRLGANSYLTKQLLVKPPHSLIEAISRFASDYQSAILHRGHSPSSGNRRAA